MFGPPRDAAPRVLSGADWNRAWERAAQDDRPHAGWRLIGVSEPGHGDAFVVVSMVGAPPLTRRYDAAPDVPPVAVTRKLRPHGCFLADVRDHRIILYDPTTLGPGATLVRPRDRFRLTVDMRGIFAVGRSWLGWTRDGRTVRLRPRSLLGFIQRNDAGAVPDRVRRNRSVRISNDGSLVCRAEVEAQAYLFRFFPREAEEDSQSVRVTPPMPDTPASMQFTADNRQLHARRHGALWICAQAHVAWRWAATLILPDTLELAPTDRARVWATPCILPLAARRRGTPDAPAWADFRALATFLGDLADPGSRPLALPRLPALEVMDGVAVHLPADVQRRFVRSLLDAPEDQAAEARILWAMLWKLPLARAGVVELGARWSMIQDWAWAKPVAECLAAPSAEDVDPRALTFRGVQWIWAMGRRFSPAPSWAQAMDAIWTAPETASRFLRETQPEAPEVLDETTAARLGDAPEATRTALINAFPTLLSASVDRLDDVTARALYEHQIATLIQSDAETRNRIMEALTPWLQRALSLSPPSTASLVRHAPIAALAASEGEVRTTLVTNCLAELRERMQEGREDLAPDAARSLHALVREALVHATGLARLPDDEAAVWRTVFTDPDMDPNGALQQHLTQNPLPWPHQFRDPQAWLTTLGNAPPWALHWAVLRSPAAMAVVLSESAPTASLRAFTATAGENGWVRMHHSLPGCLDTWLPDIIAIRRLVPGSTPWTSSMQPALAWGITTTEAETAYVFPALAAGDRDVATAYFAPHPGPRREARATRALVFSLSQAAPGTPEMSADGITAVLRILGGQPQHTDDPEGPSLAVVWQTAVSRWWRQAPDPTAKSPALLAARAALARLDDGEPPAGDMMLDQPDVGDIQGFVSGLFTDPWEPDALRACIDVVGLPEIEWPPTDTDRALAEAFRTATPVAVRAVATCAPYWFRKALALVPPDDRGPLHRAADDLTDVCPPGSQDEVAQLSRRASVLSGPRAVQALAAVLKPMFNDVENAEDQLALFQTPEVSLSLLAAVVEAAALDPDARVTFARETFRNIQRTCPEPQGSRPERQREHNNRYLAPMLAAVQGAAGCVRLETWQSPPLGAPGEGHDGIRRNDDGVPECALTDAPSAAGAFVRTRACAFPQAVAIETLGEALANAEDVTRCPVDLCGGRGDGSAVGWEAILHADGVDPAHRDAVARKLGQRIRDVAFPDGRMCQETSCAGCVPADASGCIACGVLPSDAALDWSPPTVGLALESLGPLPVPAGWVRTSPWGLEVHKGDACAHLQDPGGPDGGDYNWSTGCVGPRNPLGKQAAQTYLAAREAGAIRELMRHPTTQAPLYPEGSRLGYSEPDPDDASAPHRWRSWDLTPAQEARVVATAFARRHAFMRERCELRWPAPGPLRQVIPTFLAAYPLGAAPTAGTQAAEAWQDEHAHQQALTFLHARDCFWPTHPDPDWNVDRMIPSGADCPQADEARRIIGRFTGTAAYQLFDPIWAWLDCSDQASLRTRVLPER